MVKYGKAGCGTWLASDLKSRRYRRDKGSARQPEIEHSVLPDVYMTQLSGELTAAPDKGLKDGTIGVNTRAHNIAGQENKPDDGQLKSVLPVAKSWLDMLAKAAELRQKGLEGDRKAAGECHELLKSIKPEAPENNFLKAHLSGIVALLDVNADTTEISNKAGKYLKELDRAIDREPGNIRMRALRAYVCHCLPDTYMRRTAVAVEDFNCLVTGYENDPSIFSREFYWQVLYALGEAYRRAGLKNEMLNVWDNLLSQKSDIKFSKMVVDKLGKTGGG
ncbi:hypothetical protein DCCM_0310 [Desulfocucumis palustris]|uniref:Uncharacterized protein n=1 Tax=Desulfocucumis palustris TaxID=1898651 RepID=A0A2L2X7F7_9FIRM|nr:hypothetical protein [Desulfocucumis palustris]GBF32119.1 hypothetical protein DCCM_0310 [Desulfocucumis palustris]